MHWRLASDICAAVIEFAKTGRGNVQRTAIGASRRIRIWIDGAAADVRVDVETRTFHVLRVYKTPRAG
ncbi:hypothetical protein [Polyangium aurulentum]|uniref:hypothetical protein n=1 Tax=Polyangium aurulentum TaxID=2567896 RepID=UPI0011339F83|nr:hypothetical protein [Polyangium aurulentum]UQA56382.1 hypothetical protein E8A73_034450 [Polyangium aurulentum]